MFVKPNPDREVNGKALEVYDPTHREFLPDEGRDVPRSPYWIRRLQTGDVVRVQAATESKGEKAQKADSPKNSETKKEKAKAKNKAKSNAKKQEPAQKQDGAATESKGE